MLTILASVIFVPALIWNLVFIPVAITQSFSRKNFWSDIKALVFSLAILFIPGIYLFGIY